MKAKLIGGAMVVAVVALGAVGTTIAATTKPTKVTTTAYWDVNRDGERQKGEPALPQELALLHNNGVAPQFWLRETADSHGRVRWEIRAGVSRANGARMILCTPAGVPSPAFVPVGSMPFLLYPRGSREQWHFAACLDLGPINAGSWEIPMVPRPPA